MVPVLELTRVVKDYHGLRPLRVRELTLEEGEVVAVAGLDLPATEVLTNLITAAALPDEGAVRVFGQTTATIGDADTWLAGLERFGIVSDRVALLDTFSVRQNIALPLTLDLDPLPDEVARAVADLAAAVRLEGRELDLAAGNASPTARLRTRLARAFALAPSLLLIEHPTASIERGEVSRVASDFFKLIRSRRVSALIISADREFTSSSDRQLVFDPATGVLRRRGLRAWFS